MPVSDGTTRAPRSSDPAAYREIDSAHVAATVRALRRRISERFPGSGLSLVAADLEAVSDETARLARWLGRPVPWLRAVGTVGIITFLGAIALAVFSIDWTGPLSATQAEMLQGINSLVDEVILVGVAVVFLATWERRYKRRRALKLIHTFRSLAHIIDMHQLTKDPERIMNAGRSTPSSPERRMSHFELTRYLDYCSELLSMISKLSALLVGRFDDPVTLSAVNDLEALTGGLSGKIWQKINLIDRDVARDTGSVAGAPSRAARPPG